MADMDGTDQKETESKEECGWCKWMKAGGCSKEFTVRTRASRAYYSLTYACD